MKLIGLYSGAYILKNKDKRGFKLGRSRQTAKSAYNAIMKKYKVVNPGSKYRHVGKGVWRIYSISKDRQRTGKTTEDFKKWGKQPHKLDYKGIDTKGSKVKKTTKKQTSKYNYFIKRSSDPSIVQTIRNNYSKNARIGYIPFSSGLIRYHDERPAFAIVVQDNKSGLYYFMFVYRDGTKTAKISSGYDLSTKYSKKDVIGELDRWEKRTGNIT